MCEGIVKSVAKKGMQGWINTPPGRQVISFCSKWSLVLPCSFGPSAVLGRKEGEYTVLAFPALDVDQQ